MNHQRLRIPDVREQAEKFKGIDKLLARFESALDAKRDQRTGAAGQVLLCEAVVFARGQAGIIYPLNTRMILEELRYRERVFRVALHAKVKRLRSLQQEEGVEGRQRSARVAQSLHASANDEREISKCGGVRNPVVGGIGIDE